MKYLADALKINSDLTRIDLGANNITTEGAEYIKEMIKENSSLKALNFGFFPQFFVCFKN